MNISSIIKYFISIISKHKNYFKIALSLIILTIILFKIDKREAVLMILNLNLPTLFLLLGISLLKFLTQAVNWYFCLTIPISSSMEKDKVGNENNKSMKHPCTFFTIIKTHMIGLALRFLLPGGHGTFGKILYLDPNQKKESFFSIVIEKFFLVWVILFFASWAFVIVKPLFPKIIFPISFFIAMLVTLCPFIIPALLKKHLSYIQKKKYYYALPKIIASQIIYEVLTFTQYFILLQYFTQMDLNFIDISALIAIILLANIIPITFSGIGLREAASALLLPQVGVAVEIAVGVSLLIFLFNAVIPAIPGMVFIVTHKKTFTPSVQYPEKQDFTKS